MSLRTPAEPRELLSFDRFGFAFGERTVLEDVTLTLRERGRLAIVGPGGAGKSSLLRIVAGQRPASLKTWGEARYLGAPFGGERAPALMEQRARALLGSVLEGLAEGLPDRARLTRAEQADSARETLDVLGLHRLVPRLHEVVLALSASEQRCVSLARAFASGAALVCADEPCVGLDDEGAAAVVSVLVRLAERRAVVLVTHNRFEALALGGDVALLAGGRVQEHGPASIFFAHPLTAAGRQYVRTGGCSEPSPDARSEDLDDAFVARRDAAGPNRLRWVIPGVLAGFPRPGLLDPLEGDLETIAAAGIRILVTLEADARIPEDLAARFGLRLVHHPIADMHAPTVAGAAALCALVDQHLRAGRPVGVHCLAGLGRTGTVLGAYLIWTGHSFDAALHEIRKVEPRFVQSDEQLDFLRRFASA